MTKADFDEQLRIAQTKYEESKSLYWCGFCRGLRRAFLGSNFSKDTDHVSWMNFLNDADEIVAELGRGYRDGLETVVSYRMIDHYRERMEKARRSPEQRHLSLVRAKRN